jgi:hypothetical protein
VNLIVLLQGAPSTYSRFGGPEFRSCFCFCLDPSPDLLDHACDMVQHKLNPLLVSFLFSLLFLAAYIFPSVQVMLYSQTVHTAASTSQFFAVAAWTAGLISLGLAYWRQPAERPKTLPLKATAVLVIGGLMALTYYKIILFGSGAGVADLLENPISLVTLLLIIFFSNRKTANTDSPQNLWKRFAAATISLFGFSILLFGLSGSNTSGSVFQWIVFPILGGVGSAVAVAAGRHLSAVCNIGRYWIVALRWLPIAVVTTLFALTQGAWAMSFMQLVLAVGVGFGLVCIWIVVLKIMSIENSTLPIGFLLLLIPFLSVSAAKIIGIDDVLLNLPPLVTFVSLVLIIVGTLLEKYFSEVRATIAQQNKVST